MPNDNTHTEQWISVDERLPEYRKLVQVHGGIAWLDDDGEWYSATSAPNFMLADCITLGSIRIRWEVTHWIPYIPPPFTPTASESERRVSDNERTQTEE